MLSQGCSQRSVASYLGVSPSTVSREVRRGVKAGHSWYLAVFGQRARSAGRRRAGGLRRKLGPDPRSPGWPHVRAGLSTGWSPEQIAGRLKLMPAAAPGPGWSVSHETIYCAIYAMPRGSLRTELVKLLRRSHSGRLHRHTGYDVHSLRPPEVAARIVPGHWEGDLIKGARNASAVGTIVERTSRYVMLAKLDTASASSVLEGFTKRLRRVPRSLRKTLTYDQGCEMALHDTLAKRLRMDIFFCDPHSPWQRGSNENANGLLREYLPKGSDLSLLSEHDLHRVEYALNHRPRKILGFHTPHEVFSELKLNHIAGVALQA